VQQISADGRFFWDGAAWRQLSPDRRWFWDEVSWQPTPALAPPGPPAVPAPAVPVARALVPGPCWICEGQPGIPVTLRQVTAFVIFGITKTLRAVLCRSCGLALFRRYMNRTLATGWWGVIHFFINWFAVITNLVAWSNLRALPQESGGTGRPLAPGRPLYFNYGLWIPVVVVALLVALLLPGVIADSQPYPAADQALVGQCVTVSGTTWSPTSCAQPHAGKVVRLGRIAYDCTTDHYTAVELDDKNYACVDTSK
jgi:hypothetical protein